MLLRYDFNKTRNEAGFHSSYYHLVLLHSKENYLPEASHRSYAKELMHATPYYFLQRGAQNVIEKL